MRVNRGTAMARQVFDDRRNPGGQQIAADGQAEPRNNLRVLRKGAIADRIMGIRGQHIQYRGTVDVDAGVFQLLRHLHRYETERV